MDSDDEFNQFVMDEIIDSSSSDDELFDGAAHMIIEDSVNHPGHIGSVEGHEVVQRERLLHHDLLYKDYFSEKTIFGPKTFRRRLVFVPTISIVTFSGLLYNRANF